MDDGNGYTGNDDYNGCEEALNAQLWTRNDRLRVRPIAYSVFVARGAGVGQGRTNVRLLHNEARRSGVMIDGQPAVIGLEVEDDIRAAAVDKGAGEGHRLVGSWGWVRNEKGHRKIGPIVARVSAVPVGRRRTVDRTWHPKPNASAGESEQDRQENCDLKLTWLDHPLYHRSTAAGAPPAPVGGYGT
jgi:hypothetical protein